jgi:hypothetical protein
MTILFVVARVTTIPPVLMMILLGVVVVIVVLAVVGAMLDAGREPRIPRRRRREPSRRIGPWG